MSRHQLPTKNPRYEVFVGWAPPLQTFFGQVYDTKGKKEDQPFVWRGADGPTTLTAIFAAISPYAAVSLEVSERLVEDKRLNRA